MFWLYCVCFLLWILVRFLWFTFYLIRIFCFHSFLLVEFEGYVVWLVRFDTFSRSCSDDGWAGFVLDCGECSNLEGAIFFSLFDWRFIRLSFYCIYFCWSFGVLYGYFLGRGRHFCCGFSWFHFSWVHFPQLFLELEPVARSQLYPLHICLVRFFIVADWTRFPLYSSVSIFFHIWLDSFSGFEEWHIYFILNLRYFPTRWHDG